MEKVRGSDGGRPVGETDGAVEKERKVRRDGGSMD